MRRAGIIAKAYWRRKKTGEPSSGDDPHALAAWVKKM